MELSRRDGEREECAVQERFVVKFSVSKGLQEQEERMKRNSYVIYEFIFGVMWKCPSARLFPASFNFASLAFLASG